MKVLLIVLATTLSLSALASDYKAYLECTSFGTTATFMVNDQLAQRLVVTNTFFDKTQILIDEAVKMTPSNLDEETSVIKDIETNGKAVTLEISEDLKGTIQINKPGNQFQSQGMNCLYL